MAGNPERVDEWDEQQAPAAPAPAPAPADAASNAAGGADGDAADTRPQPTWRQMARTTPPWVWAIGCGGILSICVMFFVTMLLIFTAK